MCIHVNICHNDVLQYAVPSKMIDFTIDIRSEFQLLFPDIFI